MATLTETAYYTRKAVNWGIVGIIAFIILRVLFSVVLSYIRQAFPAPPLKPNNLFGKLSAVQFSQGASPSAQLSFTLQTVSGTIPVASEAATVYFMPKSKINLLSLSKAQSFVAKMGMTTSPQQKSSTLYRWLDLKNPLRTVELDIVSYHFDFSYDFTQDLGLFAYRDIPSPQAAQQETYSYFQSFSLPAPDVDFFQPDVQYLKLVGNTLEPASSQSQADAVKVDYFRKNYDNLPMLTDKPDQGIISFILSGNSAKEKRFLRMSYHYWPINDQYIGAYKIKTGNEAYEELKNNKAYFVSLPQNMNIIINNVYLAFYDSVSPQYYLQPIYVFEGEEKFMAYVSAVAPPWTD